MKKGGEGNKKGELFFPFLKLSNQWQHNWDFHAKINKIAWKIKVWAPSPPSLLLEEGENRVIEKGENNC